MANLGSNLVKWEQGAWSKVSTPSSSTPLLMTSKQVKHCIWRAGDSKWIDRRTQSLSISKAKLLNSCCLFPKPLHPFNQSFKFTLNAVALCYMCGGRHPAGNISEYHVAGMEFCESSGWFWQSWFFRRTVLQSKWHIFVCDFLLVKLGVGGKKAFLNSAFLPFKIKGKTKKLADGNHPDPLQHNMLLAIKCAFIWSLVNTAVKASRFYDVSIVMVICWDGFLDNFVLLLLFSFKDYKIIIAALRADECILHNYGYSLMRSFTVLCINASWVFVIVEHRFSKKPRAWCWHHPINLYSPGQGKTMTIIF